jgi:hypothetical protein
MSIVHVPSALQALDVLLNSNHKHAWPLQKDVYVRVQYNGEVLKSNLSKGTCDPAWDETFSFQVKADSVRILARYLRDERVEMRLKEASVMQQASCAEGIMYPRRWICVRICMYIYDMYMYVCMYTYIHAHVYLLYVSM